MPENRLVPHWNLSVNVWRRTALRGLIFHVQWWVGLTLTVSCSPPEWMSYTYKELTSESCSLEGLHCQDTPSSVLSAKWTWYSVSASYRTRHIFPVRICSSRRETDPTWRKGSHRAWRERILSFVWMAYWWPKLDWLHSMYILAGNYPATCTIGLCSPIMPVSGGKKQQAT